MYFLAGIAVTRIFTYNTVVLFLENYQTYTSIIFFSILWKRKYSNRQAEATPLRFIIRLQCEFCPLKCKNMQIILKALYDMSFLFSTDLSLQQPAFWVDGEYRGITSWLRPPLKLYVGEGIYQTTIKSTPPCL